MTANSRTRPEAALRQILGIPSAPEPGGLIGLEHEYVVRRNGEVVDFHGLIHQLLVPGRRLDPGDANAYRLPCGLALTADDGEAEIATPPITVRPGFASEVIAWASHGRAQLERVLPAGYELEGYSTHLSVSMPGLDGDAVAELYARTFAPALAMLLERPDSLGLYVRPRPGRLELCGEFVDGARLGAVAAFVAGSARVVALALQGAGGLPAPLAVETLPAVERYGLRVTRHACGLDLYEEGRAASLPLAVGGEVLAQDYLEEGMSSVQATLRDLASADDLAVLERMVAGRLPLGIELQEPEAPAPICGLPYQSPLGQVLRRWQRPGFALQAVAATWDFTVFQLDGARKNAMLSIPRDSLARFVAALESDRLDAALLSSLNAAPTLPVLDSHAQTAEAGAFSKMLDPVLLLPTEREPGAGAAKARHAGRVGKARALPASARPDKSTSRPWKLVIPLRPQRIAPFVPHTPIVPPIAPVGPPARPLSPLPPRFIETGPPPHDMVPGPPLGPSRGSAASGGGIPWLVVAAVAAIGGLGFVIAGAISFNLGDSDPAPTPLPGPTESPTGTTTPSATATPQATATSTPRLDAAATSPGAPTVTKTQTRVASTATAFPTASPTANAASTAAATPTPTPTRFATETPRPTLTPSPTSSPRPTATPTPTPLIIVAPPPTPKAACTPAPGTICP